MVGEQASFHDEQWVIWNGFFGVRDFVSIGEVENTEVGQQAWLEEPYDMVGPFSLDELVTTGQISFAECSVMSYQYWAEHHQILRLEAAKRQREAQEKLFRERGRFEQRNQHSKDYNEQQYRQILNLPVEGKLNAKDIKTAYRRLAQKAHPDVGGTQEAFVEITTARDALLANV